MGVAVNKLYKVQSFFQQRRKTFLFIYFILGVLSIFTVLGISGSSIGMWNQFLLGNKEVSENVIAGVPRAIRSDEWLVQTPLALSQHYNDYERINRFIGNGEDTVVIFDAPNNHWSTFFRPHNLGFFILPEENAFAFKWWFRGAIFVIATYLVLLVLTKRNYFLSIFGSLILFFTPMVQWWYSIKILEPIAYGLLSLYFAIRIIQFESIKRLFLYSVGLTYSILSFTLTVYPPFQIPVLYVVIFTFFGFAIENWNKVRDNLKIKITSLIIALFSALSVLFAYYLSARETINIFLNTSYPGERFIRGGNYSLLQFLSGPYSFLLQLNSSSIPTLFGNQSEGSSYLTIVPFVLLLPFILFFVFKRIHETIYEGVLLGSLSLLFIIFSTFIFFGFPSFLAKYSLFYLVPENRMIIGIGLTAFLGIILFIDMISKRKIHIDQSKAVVFATAILTFILVSLIGRELNQIAPQYIRSKLVIFAVSIIITTIIILILIKSKIKYGVLLFVLFSFFSSGMVNPLYLGLEPLRNSELASKLIEFNKQNNPENKKWIAYDSFVLGNYLAAQGIPTINGTHLYPQIEIWEQLDPQGKYRANYNRYSHIIFQNMEGEGVSFENPVPDTLVIKVNFCYLKNYHGSIVVSHSVLESNCLQPMGRIAISEKNSLYLYSLVNVQ